MLRVDAAGGDGGGLDRRGSAHGATVSYPWEDPSAPEHVRNRQTVWHLTGPAIRTDLPKRRPPVELPRALQGLSYGAVVMTHRGHTNGRLSILLSSLPANLPVLVSSDSITTGEMDLDWEVAEYHGADFSHHAPWDGRAGHSIQCMEVTSWDYTLFLMDDVFLQQDVTVEALRWAYIMRTAGIPLACLAIPGWELYHHHKDFGFSSWQDSLDHPERLDSCASNPSFLRAPCLYRNPFGACMLIMRDAYKDVGGFPREYWANDDCLNHKTWLSGKWVNAAMPGRGYLHYGAQSNHFGETAEYIGSFKAATGMTAEESGEKQAKMQFQWKALLHDKFMALGGTDSV